MKTLLKNTCMMLGLTGALLTACEKPDDFVNKGFDVDLFAKKLKESFEDKTVGYAFAIAKDGKIARYDNGGLARRGIDQPEIEYQATTRQGIGSCSKTITALAVLQALEDKGLNENAYLWELLPPSWNIPQANRNITVGHLLAHKAGLTHFGFTYAALRKCMQTPSTGFGDDASFYDYDNVNFLMCRVLLPCIVQGKSAFEGKSDIDTDEAVSQFFRSYVRERIFKVAGLPDYNMIDIGPWNNLGPISPKIGRQDHDIVLQLFQAGAARYHALHTVPRSRCRWLVYECPRSGTGNAYSRKEQICVCIHVKAHEGKADGL